MNIDWSKAPEGATHAGTRRGQNRQVFYRGISAYGYEFTYHDLKNWKWMRNMGEPLCLPLIPRGEQAQHRAERSKVCDEMFGVILSMPESNRHNRSDICEALYDAGYRKFEIVEDDV